MLEIIERVKPVWALTYCIELLNWDRQTYMPSAGSEARAIVMSELAKIRRKFVLDETLITLVEKAKDKLDELNDYEKGVVRVVDRAIRIARALPEELIARFAKITSEANTVWVQAKRSGRFDIFRPYLEQIVELVREKAERLGYEKHPYNALIDLFDEGITIDLVDKVFEVLIPETRRILSRVLSDGFYPQRHELEKVSYSVENARKLMGEVLELLGWDWSRGRIDESPHPFTVGLDINDVRITTRYEGYDIRRALYSTIHEYGHALYHLQIDPEIARTPLVDVTSMGLHESQSRFWENIVGKSITFVKMLKPLIAKYVAEFSRIDVVELYRYVNIVRPDLIRVDADELTYNLHIYLRYEIEKKMVEGSLRVSELPSVWNDYMDKLLGIRPRSDAEGVLQDVHWSLGYIGYFPSYTLGNVIAAQLASTISKNFEELLDLASDPKGLNTLRSWLRENIHRWGATYEPRKLVKRVTGSDIDSTHLVKYLEFKFLKLPNKIHEYV